MQVGIGVPLPETCWPCWPAFWLGGYFQLPRGPQICFGDLNGQFRNWNPGDCYNAGLLNNPEWLCLLLFTACLIRMATGFMAILYGRRLIK